MPRLTDVALGAGSDALLELVATTDAHGSSASVWRAREFLPENWIAWQPLGKPGRGDPVALSVIQQRFDGRLEAFVIDSDDHAVWHSWQTDPDEGWSDWDLLGNPGGRSAGAAVALTFLPDDRVMAVVPAGGTVWHVSPPRPEPSASWPAWSSLGQPGGTAALAVAAASLTDNRVEVVALGQTHGAAVSATGVAGSLWHRWQTTASGSDWTAWEPLGNPGGKPAGAPTLTANANGRLELFTVADGRVWHRRQRQADEPGSWTPWAPLSPPAPKHVVQDFGVARDATDRLILVAAEGYHLWHTAQTTPGASTWASWSSLARVPGPPPQTAFPLTPPALGVNHAGLMELFVVITATGKLYHLTETESGQWPPTGRSWSQPS